MPRGLSEESTPEQVFSGSPRGLELFCAVERMLAEPTPPAIRATKSQVAFREKRGFESFALELLARVVTTLGHEVIAREVPATCQGRRDHHQRTGAANDLHDDLPANGVAKVASDDARAAIARN